MAVRLPRGAQVEITLDGGANWVAIPQVRSVTIGGVTAETVEVQLLEHGDWIDQMAVGKRMGDTEVEIIWDPWLTVHEDLQGLSQTLTADDDRARVRITLPAPSHTSTDRKWTAVFRAIEFEPGEFSPREPIAATVRFKTVRPVTA